MNVICVASRTNVTRCCGGVLTGLLLLLATERVGHTGTIAYEGFDYAEVGEELLYKDGGFGFAESWGPGSGIGSSPLTLTEGSLSSEGLSSTGNRLYVASSGGGWIGLVRHLTSPIPSNETKTVYLSFLIKPESGSGSPIGWGGVGFIGAGYSGTAPYAGFFQSRYGMANFAGGGGVNSPVLPLMNETSLFVVKADLMSGQDTFTFYVDPVPGEPEPEFGSVKTDANLRGLGWLYIAAGDDGRFSVDEIRLGDTYADVTPVPEPSSAILLAIALVVVGLCRFRSLLTVFAPSRAGRSTNVTPV